jgi:hypothetical protein
MGISKSLKNARESMYGKWHNGITNKNGDFPQKDKGSEKKTMDVQSRYPILHGTMVN